MKQLHIGVKPTLTCCIAFECVDFASTAPILLIFNRVCIARLYGGGPELYLPPSLIPSPVFPLTSSLYSTSSTYQCPPGYHPATSRFLLSLLATSVYLSIPSITSQAFSLILSSVGPHTVVRFLNFAIGQGIGAPEEGDPETAVGLEDVGKEVQYKDDSQSSLADNTKHGDSDGSTVTRKLSLLDFQDSSDKEDGSSVGGVCLDEAAFNYGGIGDKVGEACACWLMKWSADILPFEEDVVNPSSSSFRPDTGHSGRRAVKRTPPKLWARGGLSAAWVCAVISSNDFFIKDEWERYEFASRVINLRRLDGQDPDEEKEWARLFQHGIHYSNMVRLRHCGSRSILTTIQSFDDLSRISQDISPATGRPYVPIGIIHSAHWMQSLLRHRIVAQSSVSGMGIGTRSSRPQSNEQLGITLNTSDILAKLSSDRTSDEERSKVYYPIPTDTSERLGDADSAFANAAASADQLLGNTADMPVQGHSTPKQANFFGILSPQYSASSCIQADATGKDLWSQYPPFRFAIEFWGVGQLLEKSRIHSHTIWYAGSLFNVYVQVVRKKGIQLGVYLRRQSSVDPIPRASAPPISVSTHAEGLLNSSPTSRTPPGGTQAAHDSLPQSPTPRGHISTGSSGSVSSMAFAVPGSPSPPNLSHFHPSTTSLATNNVTAPVQPYRDPRPSIMAYFTISCPSATGSSLTRFSSSPDHFSISQTWGWKSSSLRLEQYPDPNGEPTVNELDRDASLRATVVLGLI